MSKIGRSLKFCNIVPHHFKKESIYDGVLTFDSRLDGNICAFNRKFIACVLSYGNGMVFTVLKVTKLPGRIDNPPRVSGHTTKIIDMSWDRFYSNRIATCSEDGTFLVWVIPEDGIESDKELNTYACKISFSKLRAIQCEWHSSASDILFGATIKAIAIMNVSNGTVLKQIDYSNYSDQVFHFAVNYNSTKISVSSKDKKVRVFDVNDMEKPMCEFETHQGSRTIRTAWMGRPNVDELLLSSGAQTNTTKELYVWDISAPSAPIATIDSNTSTNSFSLYYDYDTKVIFCYARGESKIWTYEYDPSPPQLIFNAWINFAGESPKACVFGNKLCVDPSTHEILRIIRVYNKSIEPSAITVLRQSTGFQSDIFPDTCSEDPAMTAEEFSQGKVADPILKSLEGMVFNDGTVPMTFNSEVNVSSASTTTVTPSSGSGSNILNIYQLNTEVENLKNQLKNLEERFESFLNK